MEMNTLKAIETEYNGVRYRSRLEARWATFFDTLGIQFEYEKEGYRLAKVNDQEMYGWVDDIAEDVHYLPDFFIPQQRGFPKKMWFEVKGESKSEDWIKLYRLVRHSGIDGAMLQQIPNITDYYPCSGYGVWATDYFVSLEPLKVFGSGGSDHPFSFCECPFCGAVGYEFDGRSARVGCGCKQHEEFGNGDKTYNNASPRLLAAYSAARRHRFGT